jgi:hypothetical protein
MIEWAEKGEGGRQATRRQGIERQATVTEDFE